MPEFVLMDSTLLNENNTGTQKMFRNLRKISGHNYFGPKITEPALISFSSVSEKTTQPGAAYLPYHTVLFQKSSKNNLLTQSFHTNCLQSNQFQSASA